MLKIYLKIIVKQILNTVDNNLIMKFFILVLVVGKAAKML